MATGLLLVNVGTPSAPTPRAVRRYLREFLSDPRVLDMNPLGRFLLLNLVILPFRPKRSAHAYQQIWTEQGSPLLTHSRDLAAAVAARLGDKWRVELAMRYGEPTIAGALAALRDAAVDRVVVMPMFPQGSMATTETVIAAVEACAAQSPPVDIIDPFYDDPGFVAAWAEVGKPALAAAAPDYVLFSFHGLPERHIRKRDPGGACLAEDDCCHPLRAQNQHCYRAQCFATARQMASALELADDSWAVGFQSRLGRVPWIAPHTDTLIATLANGGCERLAVFCPAFVADCLETLEEIGLRGRDQFLAAGGKELVLVPSLNRHPTWVDAVAALARRHRQR